MENQSSDDLKEELKKYIEELENANASLEEFVYIASHDLREPLTGIAGYASLVQRRYANKLDPQGAKWLSEIVQGTKRLESKIDDLLALSRAGRGPLNGLIPIGSAVEEAKRSLASAIQKSGAVIKSDNLPVARANRSHLAQVFQNLISNAIKYQRSGVEPTIEITGEETPTEVIIAIKDNGIGFDSEHSERVFGVFQRLYTTEQYPGTGIGLAIVKKIIDKHGGRVWVESTPGKGSTFFFSLPK